MYLNQTMLYFGWFNDVHLMNLAYCIYIHVRQSVAFEPDQQRNTLLSLMKADKQTADKQYSVHKNKIAAKKFIMLNQLMPLYWSK